MNVYLGIFFAGFAGLSLEIALVRLLSVTTWYHLGFFAISAAMLGMTAGATKVYLSPRTFRTENLLNALSNYSYYFSLSIPVTLIFICLIPLEFYLSVMSLFALLITTVICALPYYFFGVIVSAVLTKQDLPMGKLYASDLIGSSIGCLFVLGGLSVFDAPSLILLCSALGAFAGLLFSWKNPSRWRRVTGLSMFVFFVVAGYVNSLSTSGIRPVVVKGDRIEPAINYQLERWNSFSRIAVYNEKLIIPQYWGPSRIAPENLIPQHYINIDGEAATTMRKFNSMEDIEHLKYDVTNVAYYLDRRGDTLVIGVGGGRDIQSAIAFRQKHIVGVEINPIFIDLLQNDFRDFSGISDRPDVTLVVAEARGYLSQNPEKYSVIQMSLIDTWAATGAGAFSLSENSLYTVEAWDLILNRLEENGIFTVSRWHNPDRIGETGRVVSLAVASLLKRGTQEPSKHIVLITSGSISTLLLSPQPLSQSDLGTLVETCKSLHYKIVLLPGKDPGDPLLGEIVSARSVDELTRVIANTELNYTPPTDENPYFFNMLKLNHLKSALFTNEDGVMKGNVTATLTLLGLLLTLLVVAIATIVLPLSLRKHFNVQSNAKSQILLPGVIYFTMIGSGFMLLEIALIQRLTVLLSHPIYALGILLFTLIISTGIGSFISDRLPLTEKPWAYVYPVVTAASIIVIRFLLNIIIANLISAPISLRIAAAVVVIAPMGLLMGMFFPTGMRLAKSIVAEETPWYWALNGIFGVFCSALAVFISIYMGISVNFYLAAICYSTVLFAQIGLQRLKSVEMSQVG